jgi:hypothetical protein
MSELTHASKTADTIQVVVEDRGSPDHLPKEEARERALLVHVLMLMSKVVLDSHHGSTRGVEVGTTASASRELESAAETIAVVENHDQMDGS